MTDEALWLSSQFDPDRAVWAVEVGAWNGVDGSHLVELERVGWEVLAVEPNPACERELSAGRKRFWMGALSDYDGTATYFRHLPSPPSFSGLKPRFDHAVYHPENGAGWDTHLVPVARLDTLLERVKFPQLDCLTIDTEGTELEVLRGLDIVRWKPKALVIESWSPGGLIAGWMADHGYKLDQRIDINDCYVRRK